MKLNRVWFCSCCTSIGCIYSHLKHYSIGRGHRKPIERSEMVNHWKCLPLESLFTHRAISFSAYAILSATNDTSAMPFNSSSMCAPCQIFPYSYSRSTPTAITCTEDLRMVSPTPTCARCCSSCDVKVKICVAIADYCLIQSIKHSAFWHRYNYSNRQSCFSPNFSVN